MVAKEVVGETRGSMPEDKWTCSAVDNIKEKNAF